MPKHGICSITRDQWFQANALNMVCSFLSYIQPKTCCSHSTKWERLSGYLSISPGTTRRSIINSAIDTLSTTRWWMILEACLTSTATICGLPRCFEPYHNAGHPGHSIVLHFLHSHSPMLLVVYTSVASCFFLFSLMPTMPTISSQKLVGGSMIMARAS